MSGRQRRAAVVRDFFRSASANYRYVCIHTPSQSGVPPVANGKILGSTGTIYDAVPYCEDLCCGLFAAQDAETFKWLRDIVRSYRPSHLLFERPFMFPAAEALVSAGVCGGEQVIYDSANIESTLKRDVLVAANVSADGTCPCASYRGARARARQQGRPLHCLFARRSQYTPRHGCQEGDPVPQRCLWTHSESRQLLSAGLHGPARTFPTDGRLG